MKVDAEKLDELTDRVARLRPCHRDPERYHAERDAIEAGLRTLRYGVR